MPQVRGAGKHCNGAMIHCTLDLCRVTRSMATTRLSLLLFPEARTRCGHNGQAWPLVISFLQFTISVVKMTAGSITLVLQAPPTSTVVSGDYDCRSLSGISQPAPCRQSAL
jgi:hypothetical protein